MKGRRKMTGKQRAYLRKMANGMRPILQIGKDGISENFIAQVDEALEARELIKISVLDTAFLSAREASDELCTVLKADGISAIGSKFVLYRESENKKKIELP